MKNLLAKMAVGTGIGLRYDLDFFVIRIDWGIGLHVPYKNGLQHRKLSGMFAFGNIGYPF